MARRGRVHAPAAGLAAVVAVLAALLVAPSAAAAPADAATLHLVVLSGPGTSGYDGELTTSELRARMLDRQDHTLASVDADEPVYRWTTALNGYAVALDTEQVQQLRGRADVALVERNTLQQLTATARGPMVDPGRDRRRSTGGDGVVIGVVDSGIWPDSPLFAAVPGLDTDPVGFDGACVTGEDWERGDCNAKLVGARWFVAGFGVDDVRSGASLSARDDEGHGTQVASVAAGNAGVSVDLEGAVVDSYGGIAPQARLAIYKACWTAPDPTDDGCATADVVTAIDRATADGVDVLNLSISDTAGISAVDLALLGAAEADIVVNAAAGNRGSRGYAGYPTPWATTVGAATGAVHRGTVVLADGTRLPGAMAARRGVGPVRVIDAARAAAPGATRSDARFCRPGSLDTARAAGTIVVCERGRIGRVEKSMAVQRADGVGMVLLNRHRGTVVADIHAIPTVHLATQEAGRLRRALARPGALRASLHPAGTTESPRVPRWSATGDPRGGVLKPDVLAPGTGVLGAVPPDTSPLGNRWDLFRGTSAATAQVSGAAAVLRSRRPDWSATRVRSALATTARTVGEVSSLRQGSGVVRAGRAARPGLVFDVAAGAYRRYLADPAARQQLNTPSLLLRHGADSTVRTVTNVAEKPMYYSVRATGFDHHRVEVRPAAVRLDPGEERSFRIVLDDEAHHRQLDSGWVTWRGANGTRVRVPVVIAR